MESGANAAQVLTDLLGSILKLLGRPTVQQQLLLGLFAIVLAWAVARWIASRMHRREDKRTEAAREVVLAEVRARLNEIDSQDAAKAGGKRADNGTQATVVLDERAKLALLLEDEQALAAKVAEQRGFRSRLYALIQQVLFPGLAIITLSAGYVFAVSLGWYGGLIINMIEIFVIIFLYRLAFGVARAVGNPQKITYYQQRLFGPILAVLIILLVLNIVGDLAALSSAGVLPQEDGWLTLGTIFFVTFGFYIWIVGLSLFKDLILTTVGGRPSVNAGSLEAGLTLIQYSLAVLGLFVALSVLQVNTSAIAAVTGGLSIGIGFALQDVLKNFLGGIIVLFEGSVRPGDWVEIAGTEGAIDKLSIRSTVVRTFDNVEYIVPNQDWLNSTVTTFTRSNRRVRTRVPIGVSYNADPHFVQELLVETAAHHPDVLAEPPPLAPLVQFGASSLDFIVLAWVEDAMEKDKVASELRMRIWDALAANGVEIPYPQQDIHIRSSTTRAAQFTQAEERTS